MEIVRHEGDVAELWFDKSDLTKTAETVGRRSPRRAEEFLIQADLVRPNQQVGWTGMEPEDVEVLVACCVREKLMSLYPDRPHPAYRPYLA